MNNQLDPFWTEVAKELMTKHPTNKPPSKWSKKKDFEPFIKIYVKNAGTISFSTFRRIFQVKYDGSISPAVKDIFAVFIGYSSYENYQNTNNKRDKPNVLKKMILMTLSSLFILMICSRQSANPNNSPRQFQQTQDSLEVLKIVKRAVSLEFAAYEALPNYELYLDSLEYIFWKEKSAYNNILETLTAQSELNWTLNNTGNPSNNELLKISLYSLDDDRAVVSTEEFWQIEWYSRETHEYEYFYKLTNTQKYTLTKEESLGWKILINDYEFDFYRKPPMIPNCIYVIDESDDVKQKIYESAKVGNAELATRVLDCYYTQQKSSIPSEVLELISRNNLLFRHLNTDIITEQEFNTERQKLINDIIKFMKRKFES